MQQLDQIVREARPVPLTTQVRVEKDAAYDVLDRMRAEAEREHAALLVPLDELDDTIHNAKPVPLTSQVRIDRERVEELLDQMRTAIGPGNSGPPTN